MWLKESNLDKMSCLGSCLIGGCLWWFCVREIKLFVWCNSWFDFCIHRKLAKILEVSDPDAAIPAVWVVLNMDNPLPNQFISIASMI